MARQVLESLEQVWNSRGPDASFSNCGNYRWWLKREIGESPKTIVFVGLNPSKANKLQDDATLRRAIAFASSWGYGGLLVANIFALVAKSPLNLRKSRDPIGDLNDNVLLSIFDRWSKESALDLWLGWGEGGTFLKRNEETMSMLKPAVLKREKLFPNAKGILALGTTLGGNPLHPLYVGANVSLKIYETLF